MCQLKVLHQSNVGYFAFCKHCKLYQIFYYTTFVKMNQIEFNRFNREVFTLAENCNQNCTVKDKWIKLLDTNTQMILNGIELSQLKNILSECKASLELDQLMVEISLHPN